LRNGQGIFRPFRCLLVVSIRAELIQLASAIVGSIV
jgi:hypothetical protein